MSFTSQRHIYRQFVFCVIRTPSAFSCWNAGLCLLQWYDLEGVEMGRIKLRADWKHLNNDPASLRQVLLLLRTISAWPANSSFSCSYFECMYLNVYWCKWSPFRATTPMGRRRPLFPQPSARHRFTLQHHGYGASASHGPDQNGPHIFWRVQNGPHVSWKRPNPSTKRPTIIVRSLFLAVTCSTLPNRSALRFKVQKHQTVCITLHRNLRVTELRSVICHMGSHSVTYQCRPTQVNAPHLNSMQPCCSVLDLPTPEGWKAELTWLLVIYEMV